MDETLYHSDHRLIPGDRSKVSRLTPVALNYLSIAAGLGKRFAEEIPNPKDKNGTKALNDELPRRCRMAMKQIVPPDGSREGVLLARIAFCTGAVSIFQSQGHRLVSYGRYFCEITALQDLVTLLRVSPREDRSIISVLNARMRIASEQWHPVAVGAIRVADTVEALQRHTTRVYFPTASEDALDGIDLLAQTDKDTGLCIQVKRARHSENILLMHLFERRLVRTSDQKKIVDGTKRFNHRYRVRWTPAIVMVGRYTGEPVLSLDMDDEHTF